MRNIKLENPADFSPIRAERQGGDVKKSDKTPAQSVENKSLAGSDKLEISGRGSEVGKLVGKLKELPDAHTEKVNNLREQINAGTYNPPSEKIADAILKDEKL